MDFKYTDLAKFQNFIGFESGLWCNFPNYHGGSLLFDKEEAEANFGCMKNDFFAKTYLDQDQLKRSDSSERCLPDPDGQDKTPDGNPCTNVMFNDYRWKMTPHHYDPRCRGWYRDQHEKKYSTFGEVYLFASGKPGITNCVPLWGEGQ